MVTELDLATDEQIAQDKVRDRCREITPTSRVVTVEGVAEFVPGPVDQGRKMVVLHVAGRRRFWISAKCFTDAMTTALHTAGYRDHEFFNDGPCVDVAIWLVVMDTSDREVEAKSVVLTAKRGDGHCCIALEPRAENAALYRELSEDFEEIAQELAT